MSQPILNPYRTSIGQSRPASSREEEFSVKRPAIKKQKITSFRLRTLHWSEGRTNDEIHSDIKLCPVLRCVIDTPHFQRLRGLKQLGTSEYTYINANHNRFEHSLGVAHLSSKMILRLKHQQPQLGITDKDVLCVTLAGLLHDIGHGPYSHVFDGVFPMQLNTYLSQNPQYKSKYDGLPEKPNNWTHEDGSIMMIDALLAYLGLEIDPNNLDKPLLQIGDGVAATSFRSFSSYRQQVNSIRDPINDNSFDPDAVLTSRDWIFIKEAIQGAPLDDIPRSVFPNSSGFVGRPDRAKEFLYDIVSNRHSGLDVDKIDYFARDERRTEKGNGEVEHRLIEEALVAWGDCPKPNKCFRCKNPSYTNRNCHLMIVWPIKCAEATAAFFHRRFRNHSKVYQHASTQASTYMISDILVRADPHYRIRVVADDPGNDIPCVAPGGLPISRSMLDPQCYLRLRDAIIDQIEATDSSELRDARLLIRRLRQRDLYKCVATKRIQSDSESDRQMFQMGESEIAKQLVSRGYHHESLTLDINDFIVEKSSMHLGSKEDNPLKQLRFVPKQEMHKLYRAVEELPTAIQVDERDFATHIPRSCMECSIRIYCRNPLKRDLLQHSFEQWIAEFDDEVLRDVANTHTPNEENHNFLVPAYSQVSQEAWPSQSPMRTMQSELITQEDKSPVPSRHFAFASVNRKL